MKLRNKKTGEHGEYQVVSAGYLIRVRNCDTNESYQYDCIAGFCEDWEDYKPAEPLIKDEKIRKAVRAWAEACNTKKAYLVTENEEGSTFYIYKFQSNCNFMQVATHDHNPIEGMRAYTITELCGKEEE